MGNIGALEKIRNALVGVPEAAKSYERVLELIDILKEKTAVRTDGNICFLGICRALEKTE